MTHVSQLYKNICNFRIMGLKTSKVKELQNPASVWNPVLSGLFLLGSRQSLRVPPCNGFFRGTGRGPCLPSPMFLGTFAKVRCFECNQLSLLPLSILSYAASGSPSCQVVTAHVEAL